ncbi:MAG TPA: TspO/MBR family protein [Nocardioides sp.]|nr:TspO/MBR family protein [Nocardioides sp.]
MRLRTLLRTAAPVAATAVLGAAGTKPDSAWYRSLAKPTWQPPAAAFAPVWTSIYALTAVAAARTLDRLDAPGRRRYAGLLGANLALNTGFSWAFFTAERPRLALADQLALEATTLALVRRSASVDRAAAAMLAPYALWNAFAIALNADIVRRNPGA